MVLRPCFFEAFSRNISCEFDGVLKETGTLYRIFRKTLYGESVQSRLKLLQKLFHLCSIAP